MVEKILPLAAPIAPFPDRTRRLVPLAIGGLGVSAVMTQLALMRELLGAFSGNELVFGICLGNWLLLTGAGAWLGRAASRRPRPERLFIAGQIAIAIIPLFQVVALRVLRDLVFGRGTAVGVSGTVLGSLVLLLPFCLVSGALLTLACGLLAGAGDKAGLGRVYLADTAGGIAGGALFSFVLVPWFDHFALLCFPAFLNLLLAGLLAWDRRAWLLLEAAAIVTAGLILHVALIDADLVTTVLQHRGEMTVFRANSPYGRLVVADRDGLLTFYENGVPVAATENIAQVEEAVLYALSQRPAARRVLLIGGGVAGDAREILATGGVGEVTYVELDPAIIAAGRQLLPENLDDARLRIAATDGRRFVRHTPARFDVVIMDLPDPSTSQLNRFYTAEFFGEVRRVLAPGGVFAFGLGHYENYVSPGLARLLASARGTLAAVFPHVLLIPGGRVFFLASDGPLSLDIAARLEQRGLHPRLVNRHYLDAMLAPDRLADLDRAVARPAAPNTDFSPALYYYYLRHWLSQFAARSGVLGGVLALVLAAYLARLRAAPRVIFAAGFAASALEIVLLLAYQVLYGSLYRQVGLVVTVFMAGLAAGAAWTNRGLRLWGGVAEPRHAANGKTPRQHEDVAPAVLGTAMPPNIVPSGMLPVLALAIAALGAALPLLLRGLGRLDAAAGTELAGQGAILLFTLALAALVGAQFPLAGATAAGDPAAAAAQLYSADLVGAALGALLVSALLIPLLGVTTVCLLTAGLNATAAALAWRTTTA